ncbi:hypothetical protein SAMN03080615_03949 [Amphritea atlantica]|jgi:hypothetical protein|uniref:Uncharacterized protein n=2 Tax=Amphritea TaxID=515417 RepID=A0A1H9LH74_9GAMM|nr:hypothetical protein SAMN03080615_03949 [Amphritea atlantica]
MKDFTMKSLDRGKAWLKQMKLILKSAMVAGVMSLFFCFSTDQLGVWSKLYPQAAALAACCNLLLRRL